MYLYYVDYMYSIAVALYVYVLKFRTDPKLVSQGSGEKKSLVNNCNWV